MSILLSCCCLCCQVVLLPLVLAVMSVTGQTGTGGIWMTGQAAAPTWPATPAWARGEWGWVAGGVVGCVCVDAEPTNPPREGGGGMQEAEEWQG